MNIKDIENMGNEIIEEIDNGIISITKTYTYTISLISKISGRVDYEVQDRNAAIIMHYYDKFKEGK